MQIVRAPVFASQATDAKGVVATVHGHSSDHEGRLTADFKRRGFSDVKTHHRRGLASIEPVLLASSWVHSATRKVDVMSMADADAETVIAAFRYSQTPPPLLRSLPTLYRPNHDSLLAPHCIAQPTLFCVKVGV